MGQTDIALPDVERSVASMLVALEPQDTEAVGQVVAYLKATYNTFQGLDKLFTNDQVREVVKAVLDIGRYVAAPTPELVATWLDAHHARKFFTTDSALNPERLTAIMREWQTIPASLSNAQFFLNNILPEVSRRNEVEQTFAKAQNALQYGAGSIQDRWNKAMAMIGQSSLSKGEAEILDGHTFAEAHLAAMLKRGEFADRNRPTMSLPPELGLNKFVPELTGGFITLLSGDSGGGKTILNLTIAKHNAQLGNTPGWERSIIVMVFLLENLKEDIGDRIIASATGLRIPELRKGQSLNEVKEAWSKQAWLDNMIFVRCPGESPVWMANQIRLAASRLPLGGQLLVLIDYLDRDKMDLSGLDGDNDAAKMGAAMEVIKKVTEECTAHPQNGYQGEVHTIVLVQKNEQGLPFGSRKAKFFSQLWLDLQRRATPQTTDVSVWLNRGRDASRWQTTLLETGQVHPLARLVVKKANEGSRGAVSYPIIDGPGFRVVGVMENSGAYEAWNKLQRLDDEAL